MRATASRGRLGAVIGCVVSALALAGAGCGGDEEASGETGTAPATTTATAPGPTPEEAVLAVVDDLIEAGAVPDEEAAAEVRARGGSERDVQVRLLLPEGGEDCRVRDVVAGVPERNVEIVVRYWAPFSAVSPDGDVGLRLVSADTDATSPRSAPCIAAATEILGGTPEGPAPADGADAIEVVGSGVVSDDVGVYFGAIIRNDGAETLHDVSVAFDLLDASGEIVGGAGSGEPVEEIAPGERVAVGGNAIARECGCEPTEVATVEIRPEAAYSRPDTDPWPLVVEDARLVRSGGTLRAVRADLVNTGERELEPGAFGWDGYLVLLGAGGRVIAGNVASVEAEGPIPPGGSVPLSVRIVPSLADLVGARARDAEVSVIG